MAALGQEGEAIKVIAIYLVPEGEALNLAERINYHAESHYG